MDLCIYFLEYDLFQKQLGEFEISSWSFSYELFLFCQWSRKMYIFCHKFAYYIPWIRGPRARGGGGTSTSFVRGCVATGLEN